nr:unnamed protein product [Naegleria fowleri]
MFIQKRLSLFCILMMIILIMPSMKFVIAIHNHSNPETLLSCPCCGCLLSDHHSSITSHHLNSPKRSSSFSLHSSPLLSSHGNTIIDRSLQSFIQQMEPQNYVFLHSAALNKDTAFTLEDRKKFGLRGLLPPRVETITHQLVRALRQFRSFKNPLDKYIYLMSLQMRNQTLFFRLLVDNMVEMLPIVYTPTVGDACLQFDQIWRVSQGMYISLEDKGSIPEILKNWNKTPDIIVVSDGSRILGLGDLGANGMGIPIGKLNLYVAAAGFHPEKTLPILIDVGTNNEGLLADELYLGLKRKRVRGPEFYELMSEFMSSVKKQWPNCLVQFEDFSNDVCFDLLDQYRDVQLCFNDDIQGTGAVIVAGFLNAAKITGKRAYQHKLLFMGAGSAATGVADQCLGVMKIQAEQDGTPKEQIETDSEHWIYLVDSKGLVTQTRSDYNDMPHHKKKYAKKGDETLGNFQSNSLLEIIKKVKPTAIIGLCGQSGVFTKEVIQEVSKLNEKPIVFALSNPTKNSECTAREAIEYSDGRAIFASGSPFDDVEYNGKIYQLSQGNNLYIFPALGLGAVVSKSRHVTDHMILKAAQTLSDLTDEDRLQKGLLYPSLTNIRPIAQKIAIEVAKQSVKEGMSQLEESEIPKNDEEWEQLVKSHVYMPDYVDSKL